MIGIDSSALIDLFRGEMGIRHLFENLDDKLFTTYLNYFEILTGINLENESHQEEFKYFENVEFIK